MRIYCEFFSGVYVPLKVTAYIDLVLIAPECLPCLLIKGVRRSLVGYEQFGIPMYKGSVARRI